MKVCNIVGDICVLYVNYYNIFFLTISHIIVKEK